jgi:hypothetical protein
MGHDSARVGTHGQRLALDVRGHKAIEHDEPIRACLLQSERLRRQHARPLRAYDPLPTRRQPCFAPGSRPHRSEPDQTHEVHVGPPDCEQDSGGGLCHPRDPKVGLRTL